MGTRFRATVIVIAALWMSGCAVGPDYVPPAVAVPTSFGTSSLKTAYPKPQSTLPATPDFVRWWQLLHDRQLDHLIDQAVASNPDLEIALTRVQEARTQEIVVLGAMLPTVGGSAGIAEGTGTDLTKGRVAQSIRAGDSSSGLKSISRMAGFDAGWELDLFGKYQRLLEATRDDAEARMEVRNAVLITVVAEVARNYLEIRALQLRLDIARSDITAAQKTVDLLLTRFDRGLSNELDLTLARRQLANQQAIVPELSAQISAAESRLAVLLGTYAANIAPDLERAGKFPTVLAAATARIGVATADLFPSVAVTAGFGSQGGTRQGTAVPISGPIWSVGPGAYWPLLDFGRLDALVDIQEMRTHELLVNYKKTIMVAVEEVDQAVKQYKFDQAREKALGVALAAGRRAVDLAMERYDRGVTDFLNVLDAQRQFFALEDQYSVAQGIVVFQYVAFYKVLGGGWELYDQLPPIPEAQPALIATVRRVTDGWH
jgi:outer membrane protein TolC